MPHFEYRIVRVLVDNKYPSYRIAEVFFDNDKPNNYTFVNNISSFPNPNLGISDQEAISDLKTELQEMCKAFDKPFIDADTMSEL